MIVFLLPRLGLQKHTKHGREWEKMNKGLTKLVVSLMG